MCQWCIILILWTIARAADVYLAGRQTLRYKYGSKELRRKPLVEGPCAGAYTTSERPALDTMIN